MTSPTRRLQTTARRRLRAWLVAGSALLAVAAQGQAPAPAPGQEGVVVIANPNVPRTDMESVQRIFTGKQIEVGGVVVVPANLSGGSPARDRFLASVLNQDDEKYRAYWTVRRYIGKGMPPRELRSAQEMISFVQSTPGAIGYVDAGELKPGTNVTILK